MPTVGGEPRPKKGNRRTMNTAGKLPGEKREIQGTYA